MLTPQERKPIREQLESTKGMARLSFLSRINIHALFDTCDELEKKIAELEAWKQSAMQVMNSLDLQAIAKELALRLGEDVSPAILPGIRQMKARIAVLEKVLGELFDESELLAPTCKKECHHRFCKRRRDVDKRVSELMTAREK